MPPKDGPRKIAIVGGGIGGLFAANALRHCGFEVDVYEQAPALTEIGGGVGLTPNGVRMLDWAGLRSEIRRIGAHLAKESRYMKQDRTFVAPFAVTDSSGQIPALGVHGADLIDILAAPLPAANVHTGHRCVGFDQDEDAARVTFENGSVAEADLVIGADGLHSVLAREVDPSSEPIYSGTVSFRGLVPAKDVPDVPDDEMLLWIGEGQHIMIFPVRAAEMINFAAFIRTTESLPESWTAKGDVRVLEEAFSDWDPWLKELIGHVDESAIYGTGLYDRLPRERWSNGRLTLLGDAAHPMLPHVGQGANQSLEDGATLAHLLANADGSTSEILAMYEQVRKARTAKVQSQARTDGRQQDSMDDDLTDRDARVMDPREFWAWIVDYDAIAEAERALATV